MRKGPAAAEHGRATTHALAAADVNVSYHDVRQRDGAAQRGAQRDGVGRGVGGVGGCCGLRLGRGGGTGSGCSGVASLIGREDTPPLSESKRAQLRERSTSLLALIHGIIARSFSPTTSIW